MRILDQLERKIGRYAIQNLTIYLIAGQSFFYVMYLTNKLERSATYYSAGALMSGEWWRIFTLPFDPPQSGLLFTLLAWYFFYMLGTALEQHWGAFRYNIYLLLGCVITVAASFLVPSYAVSNTFIAGSVFLAFATLFPEFQVLLFFVIPVKMKWLALVTWVLYGLQIIGGDWGTRLMVVAAIANYLIFFAGDIMTNLRYGRKQIARKAVRSVQKTDPISHKCTTCGITDKTHPDMDFRYCPQCKGQHGYCRDHIFSHQHKK